MLIWVPDNFCAAGQNTGAPITRRRDRGAAALSQSKHVFRQGIR